MWRRDCLAVNSHPRDIPTGQSLPGRSGGVKSRCRSWKVGDDQGAAEAWAALPACRIDVDLLRFGLVVPIALIALGTA